MKYNIGIDFGGTDIKIGIVKDNINIVKKDSFPTNVQDGYEKIIKRLSEILHNFISENGLTMDDVNSIGIGFPSSINPKNNHIIFANNLGWKDKDVISELKKYIDKDIKIANDADCATYGETIAGAARDYKNVVMLTLGTGVGGGIVWDGKPFKGGNGWGCEPGHIIINYDGEFCTCGRQGCLEAYASATALIKQTRKCAIENPKSLINDLCENNLDKISGRTAFNAARNGDEWAQKVVNNYIYYLSVGVSNLICLLRPEIVVLGGGISNEGDYLIKKVEKKANELSIGYGLFDDTPVIRATLGNTAGIIGSSNL